MKQHNTGVFVSDLDLEIIIQAQQGDEFAFNTIVETFQTPVYNLCYRMLGNPQEAEDAAQESFWRAYQAIAKYDPNRSFPTWLLSITAHYCIDQQRRRRLPTTELDDILAETAPDVNTPNPETVYSQGEHEENIQSLLLSLPELDRAAIVLRYWHEASEEEISQTLGITVSAVKSRLHRSRRKLAKVWETKNSVSNSVERMRNGSPAF
ncbi:MAG: RNA polymerase subunit sigma-24 [Anaerolineaceae bacterium]|nr:RNA polymerase subunit sigma-24 [Anaerolineaceae bacterium]